MTGSSTHEAGEEYSGPVNIISGETRIAADARLRGAFQPIDGLFHWYGRLAASPEIDALGAGARVVLHTEHGWADGRLSDVDPWGRLRIAGTGHPPF